MSRTTRTFNRLYRKGGDYYNETLEHHERGVTNKKWWRKADKGRDFYREHALHGRDGGSYHTISEPFLNGRNCLQPWCDVWGVARKREAKAVASRLRRIIDKRILKAELRALNEDAESGVSVCGKTSL